jgi:hypothetical protein
MRSAFKLVSPAHDFLLASNVAVIMARHAQGVARIKILAPSNLPLASLELERRFETASWKVMQ